MMRKFQWVQAPITREAISVAGIIPVGSATRDAQADNNNDIRRYNV